MRNYSITKQKNNTHYSVSVTDSYGRQKGSFFRTKSECHEFIYSVWENEVPKTNKEIQEDLLSSAISNCIEIDKQNNINLNLD